MSHPTLPPPAPPQQPARDLRVGLIGFGLAGASFHGPLIAVTPGLRLAAVVTSNPDRRQRVEREYPGALVVDSADALWEHASGLDVAVIASPNRTHAPLALAALRAGLHAVVDKPFAATAAGAREVVAEARARALIVAPFQNRRWDGDFLTVRKLIGEGVLGEVRRFESRYERWPAAPKARWCEADAPEKMEGIVWDLATHLVDQALMLFGPVREVYAEVDRRHPAVKVEDDSFIALTHASGVRSHLYASSAAPHSGARFTVSGSRAAYVKFGMDPQEEPLRRGVRPDQPGWGEEPEDRWGEVVVGGGERYTVRTEPGQYPRFYAGLVDALRTGGPSPVPPDDAVAAIEVVEAVYRSSAEQRVIAIARERPA